MEEPKKYKVIKLKKKYAIILVVALLAVFGIVVGTSYAFFSHSVTGEDYIVYTGTLEVEYEKKTDVVNLQDTKPMTNEEGLALDPYSFDIKNQGSLQAKYQVKLELDDSTTLPLEYVKVSVYKNDTEYLKPTKLSNLNANLVIIKDGLLSASGKDNYKIRFWVDINAGNDTVGKIFKAKVVINAMQNVADGFESNAKPIIVLNKDANGNTDLLLNVNDTYTELGVSEVRDDKDVIKVSSVTTTGTVDTTQVGVYEITYTVTDSDNNTTTVIRNVIVNDGSLPIYTSTSEVAAAFNNVENKEAISCSIIHGNVDIYVNCTTFDSFETALASKVDNCVVLANSFNMSDGLVVTADKDVTLDLNGKTINYPDAEYRDSLLTTNGHLTIIDSAGTGNITVVGGNTINVSTNGLLTVNSGAITSEEETAISNEGTAIINNGTITGNDGYAISNEGTVIINNGTIVGTEQYGTALVNSGTATINGGTLTSENGQEWGGTINNYGTITINDGTITGTDIGEAIFVNSGMSTINGGLFDGGYISNTLENHGIENITGGVFLGQIYNESGTINITQTDKPIYISSQREYRTALSNTSTTVSSEYEHTWTININANKANACTDNYADTTTGLCVYSFEKSAIKNNKYFNISGGTYVSEESYAIENEGIAKICDVSVKGKTYDIYNSSKAELNYNNVTFGDGTTTSTTRISGSGTITSSATCPIE